MSLQEFAREAIVTRQTSIKVIAYVDRVVCVIIVHESCSCWWQPLVLGCSVLLFVMKQAPNVLVWTMWLSIHYSPLNDDIRQS